MTTTNRGRTYSCAADLDFTLGDLPRLPSPDRVLLADPREFDVAYAINPHMRDASGALKRVDRVRARAQWTALREAFERLGIRVEVLSPLAGHPDLVFCANQVLPLPPGVGGPTAGVVASNMAHAERRGEVPHVTDALMRLGVRVERLASSASFEGSGDGLWHPGRRLLWAGVGARSSIDAWSEIAQRFSVPVAVLELRDPDFYHLDTCLAFIDETTCLWVPSAFDALGQALVRTLIARPIAVDESEARAKLACNACSVDGRHVLIQAGCTSTRRSLEKAGYTVVEVETGEFLKSGGSVFCMKLLFGPSPA